MSFCANCTRDDVPLLKRDGYTLCVSCSGGTSVTRQYVTPPERRLLTQKRRDMLRAARRCINGPLDGRVGMKGVRHGRVVSGGKCQHCIDVHAGRRSAA